MPEQPPSKRRPVVIPDSSALAAPVTPYAELHCRTNFSFLEGASHPDELVGRGAELGYAALAITDRHSLAGVVRAHVAAKSAGLKLLIGAEIAPLDTPPLTLLATDRAAYGRLCRLLTRGRQAAPKGECRLSFADVAEHAEGLLASLVLAQWPDDDDALKLIHRYREVFTQSCYAVAELHLGVDDRRSLARQQSLARRAGLPLVAANDVYYHEPNRRFLQDVLTAIRTGCTVAELGSRIFPNAERYLKSPQQLREQFADCPEALFRTLEVAARCSFSLDELRYEYPRELCPEGTTPLEHLCRLTWEGARERYPQGLPDKIRRLVEHELRLIEELRYEAYFLTVWDLVRFARSRGILCQGRGSAANSVVCFCLGVTAVDPERIDVLFERFVSKERNEAPDIDIDFEHARREEVIQYVYEKYGRDRAAMTAEVICYRPKSAVRDVGKALGLSLDRVDALSKSLEHYRLDDRLAGRFREAGLGPASRVGRQLAALVQQIIDFPRHLSQHVGGLVITQEALCELVPIENATMPGRTVIEWDKDDLDALGILKVDCLALGMLTAIHKCFDLVERHYGRHLTLANVPAEDPAVYDMVCSADTIGVFQIESRAQMTMLPRLAPRCFYDLVIEVAIVRPGPLQGGMVHPYLRRRAGEEEVQYPDERVREVLEKTLGVPIFQEQAMRLAIVAAGFTPGQADQLRRAMGAWRRPGIIDQFRQKLLEGMLAQGYPAEFAERVFRQIRGFGEYGFPESHAASFALLVYVSAWLKRYYPAAFTAALLNSQPMGFYAPAQLVGDVRRHNVEVRPADVNFSDWETILEASAHSVLKKGDRHVAAAVFCEDFDCRSEPVPVFQLPAHGEWGVRLGLRLIGGLSQVHAIQIVAARSGGFFRSIDDIARRAGLSNSVLARLSRADAFRSLQLERRSALWNSLPEQRSQGQKSLPLFDDVSAEEPAVELPPLSPLEEVIADYATGGLSLRDHPLKFARSRLQAEHVTTARDLAALAHGHGVLVAGLVLFRQRPATARGLTFVTLEDETGVVNLIVLPEIWERYRRIARGAQGLMAGGTVQRRDDVIHVMVDRLRDLGAILAAVNVRSRDFR